MREIFERIYTTQPEPILPKILDRFSPPKGVAN